MALEQYEIFSGVGIPVELPDKDAFRKIRETLTRIGIANRSTSTLYQSCHIFHKRGFYVICHFKEMFKLDGKPSSIVENDLERRNTIAVLLQQWGLLKILDESMVAKVVPIAQVTIIPHREKSKWNLVAKYTLGAGPDSKEPTATQGD